VAALTAVGALSMYTLERVKVGGPIDTDIISGKDLMADVLPPPMYLVETHLTVQESAGVGDPKRVAEFTEKYTALRKEYDDRQAHWVKNLPPGAARDLVTGPLHASAREYFDVCEKQLVPALQAGNEEKARELANGVLKDKYRAQRAVVDKVVALATAETEAKSKEAAATVSGNTRLMIGLMVCVPLVSCVIAVVIVRAVTGKTAAALERAADYERQVVAMSAAQAVIEFEIDGTIRSANDNFLGLMGYTLKEVEGEHHRIFTTPAYAASNEYKQFWAKLGNGESQVGEFERVTKRGEIRWIRGIYFAVSDANGEYYKVVKIAVDVTAAKAAESEAARTRSMIESAPINVMFADREFKIRYANKASFQTLKRLEKYLSIRSEELIGSSIDVFHKRPEHQRRMLSDSNNLPHTAQIQVGPETLELNVSAVTDERGQFIGTMLSWSIITEQLALEKQVKDGAEQAQHQAENLRVTAEKILASVNAVAAGDFTQQLPAMGDDAMGQIAAALNKAIVSVRTALEGVREVSEQLADASGQLASASEEIATGAQEQASSLEETARALSVNA
jgi:PAS domain S-box-containing protein